MIASVPQLLTAEEFARRPSPPHGGKEELVRGEIEMSPPPGFEHGFIQVCLAALLHSYVTPRKMGRIVVESGVVTERDPDTVRGPDISYWSIERLPLDQMPRGYPDVSADLCIEVLSPDDRMPKVRRKLEEYFARGVRRVWVVDPKSRIVVDHRSAESGETVDEMGYLDGEDVIPGFRCRVAEIFA